MLVTSKSNYDSLLKVAEEIRKENDRLDVVKILPQVGYWFGSEECFIRCYEERIDYKLSVLKIVFRYENDDYRPEK